MTTSQSKTGISLRVLLAALLALFGFALYPVKASATSTDMSISDAKAAVASSKYSLAEAQKKLDSIQDECDELQGEISDMQVKVDDLAKQALVAQQAMIQGREALGSSIQYNYRTDSLSAVLDIVFGASDWSEFSKGIDYMSAIMDKQAADVEEQKRLRKELETVSEELTKEKDQQEQKLNELEQKCNEAQQVVSQVSEELAENSAALEELQEKAAAIAEAKKKEQEKEKEKEPAGSGGTDNSNGGGSSGDLGGSSSDGIDFADGTWRTGVASAYGGSSDPNTPNPGTTATGDTCDDWSMGVAIPTSWDNYRSYFGKTVQISYGGVTVTAIVNDCGGMGGGTRSLDLQPGVFKALGYDTCNNWGVRTVSYRFL